MVDEADVDTARQALIDARAQAEADAELIASSRSTASRLRAMRERPDHLTERLRHIIRGGTHDR